MYPFRADLHCHSTCSDGTDTPFEILELAAAAHLQGLSITDHDTLQAYSDELFDRASDLGLQLIVGVEISSIFQEKNVHVLGYNVDLTSSEFSLFLEGIREKRKERNRAILQKLSLRGMLIDEPMILANPTAGRPHIAQEMVRLGYVLSVQAAFDLYLKDGASCYEVGFKRSSKEVIEAIQHAGGKAILAHPHFFPSGDFLEELLSLNFDGIECYYGLLSDARQEPWIELARRKKWLITGGSDYHGSIKPHIKLGSSFVDQALFDALCS